ncbi:OX-2 membrane glycoprotein-like isoform X2 [Dendrobates tinctorius]|uniref:OX-2 membrane glycoprotein-like isoform X2 n=1 Tax=Dendrobates tinctorius TaxID=92724 RepID=UPI003CCA2742
MMSLGILVFLCSCVLGSIRVKHTAKKTARLGGNVTFECQLMTNESNVIQITWHKESGNFTGAVATASKAYGHKLLGYYMNRAKHSSPKSLNITAITISPVTLVDEGCFKCIFNLFPFGASTGTICLKVYEEQILEPNLEVHKIGPHDILDILYIITCSATGYPAPNITWKLPENLNIAPEIHSIVHQNETETVISNFTLNILSTGYSKVHVICVVRHPALNSEKYLSTDLNGTGYKVSEWKFVSTYIIIIFIILILSLVMIIVFVCMKKKRKSKRYRKSDQIQKALDLS